MKCKYCDRIAPPGRALFDVDIEEGMCPDHYVAFRDGVVFGVRNREEFFSEPGIKRERKFQRIQEVIRLRDEQMATWSDIAQQFAVTPATAYRIYHEQGISAKYLNWKRNNDGEDRNTAA